MRYAKSKNLTVFDVLTIASMIEREAGVASQRKLVASVDLQPPARRDAAGDRRDDPLRHRQLRRAADRIAAGRRLALQHPHQRRPAAGPDQQPRPRQRSRPPPTRPRPSYLYYVNKPNTCNELAFAKTEAEFESDVAKYNAAREANGGNEPTTCGE